MRSSTYSKLCRRAWIGTRPGRSSEITTAHHHDLPAKLRDAGLAALADLGFVGLDDDPVEHGFADLKGRRVLTKPRLDPTGATELLRALLLLTYHQTTR
jgi:hypothetical protein